MEITHMPTAIATNTKQKRFAGILPKTGRKATTMKKSRLQPYILINDEEHGLDVLYNPILKEWVGLCQCGEEFSTSDMTHMGRYFDDHLMVMREGG
jgi:hypothetical protein